MLKALHENTRRLPYTPDFDRMLLNTAADGCWVVDADLVVTFVNATLCRWLGYREEELVGNHLLTFVAPESLSAIRRAVALREVRTRQSLDITLRRSDATPLYAIFSLSTLFDPAGSAVGSSIFVTDITHRHADEIALRNEREQWAAATQRLNRFLDLLSTTLKDPVSAIVGFSEALQAEAPDGRIGTYAASCRDAAQHIVRVMDDVALWASIQTDTGAMEPCLFDVAGVVHDTMEWASAGAVRRRVALINGVDDVPVLADVAATMTVLKHLLDNAIRFSRPGTQVTVAARRIAGDVEIQIADQGIGIPPARQAHLFQLDAPHATPDLDGDLGSGMGLMICQALVARMGGTLHVESREGVGTTVTFTLPSGRALAEH